MSDQLDIFTDRREAIALFDHLRGRDPRRPWPLLPILTFVAPGGSGKSTLIEYLRAKKCCLPDGRVTVPYALLDFTQSDAPKSLLPILVALRNELQQHDDGQGRHLTFPRFDLGAAIALSIPADGNLPLMSEDEVQHRLFAGLSLFGPLGEMGNALGSIVPIIPPLLVALKWTAQIPLLQNLLQRLEKGAGWKWYRTHSVDMGLPNRANIREVILSLHDLSLPGKPEKRGREKLLGQLLPAAFVADLRDALESPDGPRAWSKTANVVLFFDGYETLLGDPANTGIRLLEALTLTEHRERGVTDPLLVVLGSRQHLLAWIDGDQGQPSEFLNTIQEERTAQQYAQRVYERWKQRLPDEMSYLELGDLYLPLWLQDFSSVDTRNYLLQIDKQRQRPAFANDALVTAIHRVTYGHPLSLALAAAAVLAAQARHQELNLNAFELARVSRKIVRGHEHEQIRDYLLSLLLSQLGETGRNELIFCAVPRTLDAATLRTVLRLSSDLEMQKRWDLYRHLTFIHTTDEKSMILHPIVRTLLLQRLPPSNEPESDYHQIHTLLREHFHKRATRGDGQAKIEEAYHALALGDPEPAITFALSPQHEYVAMLKQLLEAVTQAPTNLMPLETEQRASDALVRGRQHHDVKSSVTALILYNWLLTATHEDRFKTAQMQSKLGAAYSELPIGDRAANLAQAIACYQDALHVWTIETAPTDYATIQHNLGLAYLDLSVGDQTANLTKAIKCFREALRIWTPEHMPLDYAMAQNTLGFAYAHLLTGDRRDNLTQAIACYQEALRFRRPDTAPSDYATTEHNLGNTYSELPIGDRAANLAQAIACYQEALHVWTIETTPFDYASTQHDLGTAYSKLPTGDRAANLAQAIACYQEALRVWIPEMSPFEYALTQYNLGNTYSALSTGNRAENAARAITCYQEAFRFWTPETAPAECCMNSSNLAHLYFAKQEWEAALDAYRIAIDAGERIYLMGQLIESRATEEIENAALYHYAAFTAAHLGKVTEALLILERGKTRQLAGALRLRVPRPPNVSDEDWNAFERAGTAIRAAQYGNTAMFDKRRNLAQPYAVREQAVRAANLDLNMAIERLRVHAPDFLREIDLIATHALLPDERTALVSFCITDLGSIGFVVSANQGQEVQAAEVTNFTWVELRLLLDDWQKTYDQFRSNPTPVASNDWQKTITRTLTALGQRLLAPILFTLPPHIERIIFLPSVELFLLPLHAASLSDSDTSRVCDLYQVSYAPSIKVLADISTQAKIVQGTLPELYAVINPSENPHLIFTSTEGAAIAGLFTQHNVDEGRIGTKQRVIAEVRGKAYVHFACSSTYDWNDPTKSGLDLADGRLTLTDLQEGAVDMSAARLVTLSSSETGITDIVQGSAEEYVGLPAGFMLAGVPCVVSSLWDASDLPTALIMERFYRNHLKEKMNFAAALREAQRWMRELGAGEVAQYVEQRYRQSQQKDKMEFFRLIRYYRYQVEHNPDERPFAHPYYWAAFTVNGW